MKGMLQAKQIFKKYKSLIRKQTDRSGQELKLLEHKQEMSASCNQI